MVIVKKIIRSGLGICRGLLLASLVVTTSFSINAAEPVESNIEKLSFADYIKNIKKVKFKNCIIVKPKIIFQVS